LTSAELTRTLTISSMPVPPLLSPRVDHLWGRGYLVASLLDEGQRHYQARHRKPEDEFLPAAPANEEIR
jgi:hypothetical protein